MDRQNQVHMISEYEIRSFSINAFQAKGKNDPAPHKALVMPIRVPILVG